MSQKCLVCFTPSFSNGKCSITALQSEQLWLGYAQSGIVGCGGISERGGTFVGPTQDHIPGNSHPGSGFRGWEMACIEAGSEGGTRECRDLYNGLRVRWDRRLSQP